MITDNRASELSRRVLDTLWGLEWLDFVDEGRSLRSIKKGFMRFNQMHTECHETAVNMIQTQKRDIIDGTPEWDILYKKYYEAEMKRKNL